MSYQLTEFLKRRSARLAKNRPMTQMQRAQQNLCRKLELLQDDLQPVEIALQEFVAMFNGPLPDQVIAALAEMFSLDDGPTMEIDDATWQVKESPTSRRRCCLRQPKLAHQLANAFNSVIIMYPDFKFPSSQNFIFSYCDVLPKARLIRHLRTRCSCLLHLSRPSASFMQFPAMYLCNGFFQHVSRRDCCCCHLQSSASA
jgi:hypothetical protein